MEPIFIIAILIMSIVVHEVSHGFAALALGDPTAKLAGRLTMNPISHLDIIGSVVVPIIGYMTGGIIIGWAKPVPFNPHNLTAKKWGEALVAIAGPLSNIILAIVFGLIIRVFIANGFANQQALFLASYLVFINIILALFNLVPIPPLDGSKILFALIPYKYQNFRHSFERYGIVLVFIFIFFLWSFIFPFATGIFRLIVGVSF